LGLIIEHIRLAVFLLRLQPFDISTAEGRSKERYRRAGLTALGSLAGKGLSFFTLLISVPLTLHYLGAERFGMWMTISSIIMLLTYADLGIGNALLNMLSEANGKENPELANQLVSTAFFTVGGISTGLALLFALAYPFVAWSRVFNVSSERAIAESGPALAVFAACFFVSLPLNIAPRVRLGYQDGVINDLWSGIGNVTGLIGVLVVIYLRGGLPWLVVAFSGAPILATFMNGLLLFVFQRPWLRPKPDNFSAECLRRLFGLGSMFLLLQVSMSLGFLSDNIIVAHAISANAVAQYAVPQRMFGFASILVGLLLGPLWPAYGEAVARGDHEWVRRTFRRSLKYAMLVSGAAAALFVIFGHGIVQLWVGSSINPSLILLVGFGIWTVMSSAGSAIAIFLNGAGVLRFQIGTALSMAIAAVFLKLLLATRMGVAGIIWGTDLAYLFVALAPCAWFVPSFLKAISDKDRVAADAGGTIPLRTHSVGQP
jgi:O-antigen/teichoic acid export membrane protein